MVGGMPGDYMEYGSDCEKMSTGPAFASKNIFIKSLKKPDIIIEIFRFCGTPAETSFVHERTL